MSVEIDQSCAYECRAQLILSLNTQNSIGAPPKCRMGEPLPPSSPIRFPDPNCKNPSSAAWLGNNDCPRKDLTTYVVHVLHDGSNTLKSGHSVNHTIAYDKYDRICIASIGYYAEHVGNNPSANAPSLLPWIFAQTNHRVKPNTF